MVEAGVPTASVDEYVAILGLPDALETALASYRSAGQLRSIAAGPITVPTLYLWAPTTAPSAAQPPRRRPAEVTEALLDHLRNIAP